MVWQKLALVDFSDKPDEFLNLDMVADLRRMEQSGWEPAPC